MITNAERCRVWANNNRELKRQSDRNYKDKKFFGGNINKVLERDNWECRECGMSQEQHMILFNYRLVIHHLDGNGRNKDVKNNSMENLITLCVRCHARVDIESKKAHFKKGTRVNAITGKGGRKKGTPNKPKTTQSKSKEKSK